MKQLILPLLLLTSACCYASKRDSLFQRHQISFAMANGVSVAPYSDLGFGLSIFDANPYYPFHNNIYCDIAAQPEIHIKYLPNYTLHGKVEYSLGLSKLLRIETGFGYLLQGLTLKYVQEYYSSSVAYCYIGALAIPLHIKFTKKIHKGVFTCTFGPNITFPFQDFSRTTNVWENGVRQPSLWGHQLFHSFTDNSSVGLDIKLGYEKALNKHLTINAGPGFYMMQIFAYNYRKAHMDQNMPQLYLSSYAGLDVALNFCLKK